MILRTISNAQGCQYCVGRHSSPPCSARPFAAGYIKAAAQTIRYISHSCIQPLQCSSINVFIVSNHMLCEYFLLVQHR